MRFRKLTLRVHTTDGPYGVTLDFPDGLVIVWADNSMGKSTCVKSILVALGMEAMLTTTQSDLPLPPAVKARLESDDGEFEVLESEVFLEVENKRGERIVVQRTIKGARDKNLITVHEGSVLTDPSIQVSSKDFFVNRRGAASRELGFHNYLAYFLDWPLPLVKTYDDNEYPLYMQCIFPYFVVEQTRGWSTVQPPLPTHFRIKDAHKRAVEFLLSMDAHKIAIRRQETLFAVNKIESSWNELVTRAEDVAERNAGKVQSLPHKPVVSWPPQIPPSLMFPSGDEWISINLRISLKEKKLQELVEQEIPRVEEIALSSQADLSEAEQMVSDKQTVLSRVFDALEAEESEVKRIEERLGAIAEDIQKSKDVRTLRNLGSRKDSVVDSGECPICHQSIHDSLVPLESEQEVMSIDENIKFLEEQRRTYEMVLANAKKVAATRSIQVRVLREELSSLRETVRTLKQTLVSDGRLPSLAAIRSRVELESSLAKDRDTMEEIERVFGGFEHLAKQWSDVQKTLQSLPKDDVSVADKMKLAKWTNVLRQQLTQYGFMSFSPDYINISPDTYRPEHEGFDVETSFNLQTSVSASDLIRTIWSYLDGLLEISRTETTNHPGCLIFDEPKQQSAKDISFKELLTRAASSIKFGQQVIFFTSENRERLNVHLKELAHSINTFEGRVLKKIETT